MSYNRHEADQDYDLPPQRIRNSGKYRNSCKFNYLFGVFYKRAQGRSELMPGVLAYVTAIYSKNLARYIACII